MPTVSSDPSPGSRERRVDARRNLEAILEAARALLAEDGTASMGAIAAAAGVHRATVHRHFPAREDLLAALHARANEASLAALRASRAEASSPGDAVQRVTQRWIEIVAHFRVPRWRGVYAATEDEAVRVDVYRELRELFEAGVAAGALRGDVPVLALVNLWIGLVIAAGEVVALGETSADTAAGHVVTLLRP